MKKILMFILALAIICIPLQISPMNVSAANTEAKKVKLGYAISVAQEGASYSSSNKDVAFVTKDGYVVGKKTGSVSVYIKKNGKTIKTVKLQVLPNEKKESMYVSAREINISVSDYAFGEYNAETKTIPYSGVLNLKNIGAKTVSKVECQVEVGSEKFVVKTNNLAAGKTYTYNFKGTIKLAIDNPELIDSEVKKAKETKVINDCIKVYSNNMVHSYDYVTGKYTYDYATADKKAPKITGFVGKDSYSYDTYKETYELVPLMVVYSNESQSYDYFKYVHAEDDRDVNCDLTVDTSKVNFKKAGVYNITYTAKDAAGNKTTAKAKLGVRVENSLDLMCDDVLAEILEPGMTDQQKARKIYEFTRNGYKIGKNKYDKFAYLSYSDKSSWEKAAKTGLTNMAGDCFTFYAINRALLTRIGLPNIPVNRTRSNGRHWWGMVYINGGFYHIDSTPRSSYYFGLVTDAQLKEYNKLSEGEGTGGHYFSDKPKSATKKLYGIKERFAKF